MKPVPEEPDPHQWELTVWQQALMRMVHVNRRKLESRWAQITVTYLDLQRIRMLTDLQLPLGSYVVWEITMEHPDGEDFAVKAVLEKQKEVNHNAGKYEYQARLLPGEDHLWIVKMKESYTSVYELEKQGFSKKI